MTLFEMKQAFSYGKTIFDLPLKVAYYARVSTEKEEQINSLENQVSFFENYIRKNPKWIFVAGYIDEGISGTTSLKREKFMKMIEDAKQKKFDLIISKEVSRFSRDTIDSLFYTRKLLEYDVCVYFLSDNIITASNDGELRLTIMSSMAQDEVRKISERTKFGFKRAIEKGTVLGTDNIWGYKKDKGRLVIDEEEAPLVKMIFYTYANNSKIGLKKLATELAKRGYYNHNNKPFHQNTLKRIIQNPKYKGYYTGGLSTVVDYRTKKRNFYGQKEWITYKDNDKVPPIVSEELWEKANSKLLSRSKLTGSNKKYQIRYPLSGKIYCNKHKCSYIRKIRHYKEHQDIYWYCGEYHKTGRKTCHPAYIKEQEIYDVAINKLNQYQVDKEEICNELLTFYRQTMEREEGMDKKQKLEEELNKLIKKKDKLLDLVLDGVLSKEELGRKNEELTSKIAELEETIKKETKKKLENSKGSEEEYLNIIKKNILKELKISLDNVDEYIEELVERIIVKENKQQKYEFEIILK